MNNLKITFRNLRRGGIYSVINIGGLAIGMAAAILILVWIHYEWSYDRFHAKEKQLYVVYNRVMSDGSLQCSDGTPMVLGPALKTDYPEIAEMARMANPPFLYANGDTKLKISTGCTDSDFLTMFDFPLLQGNRETALNDPHSVVLTEKAAIRLFGRDDPMGKTLLVNNQHPMTVTGVMKDLPGNTMFRFEALASASFLKVIGWYNEHWTANSLMTFVELQPNARLDQVNESISGIIQAHTKSEKDPEVFLYPINKQHLYSKFENGIPAGGLIETLRLFGLIAGLILLIACINFMNLSTARSEKRAKEVGVRKVMGGKRLSLIRQFLGESTMFAFIAGIVALVLIVLALPVFSTLIGQRLTLDIANGWFWLAAIAFVLFTGLLAGSYPAFYLSSFLPEKVLKGLFRTKQASVTPRKILVVVQFTVACLLIVSTSVIHRQIKYGQDRESGYDKDQLVYTSLDGDVRKNYEMIKRDLLSSGTAVSVTKTISPMTAGWNSTWGVSWQGKDPDARLTFDLYCADTDWTKTVGTTIAEGRDIDIYTYPTDSAAMLINEAAVKVMNFENPIGETINFESRNWHIVGVVKNFILNSPYDPVAPMIIGGPSLGWFSTIHIKLNKHNRMANNLAKAEQVFRQYNPNYPFEYQFADEDYAVKFREEQKLGTMATWFAGLTIFISCLGLFALVAYMAETRKKEIGIRKVLGASVANVMYLLSKEFLILVLISVAVALPVAWWIMDKWLANYAYHTNIPWWLLAIVALSGLSIALVTVSFQAIKAATANPVKAIKTE